jgi:hypothetical protein
MQPFWIIFYEDGSTFSNEDGLPSEAPPLGVMVLLQRSAQDRIVLYTQKDYYCWGWRDSNEWVNCEPAGFWDYMFHHTGEQKAVLFGRWTTDDNYMKVWNEANRVWKELANGAE